VREDIAVGSVVATFSASDADSGAFGTVWYSLINADVDSPFLLPNSTVGRVTIGRPLDAEEVTLYVNP
jgi:hypothetical protein